MYVGAVRATYRVRGARSLKDKRKRLRSLIERLRSKFRCSVAEVDAQDAWQRAVVGVALTAADAARLAEAMDAVVRYLQRETDMEPVSVERDDIPFDDLADGAWDDDDLDAPPGLLDMDLSPPPASPEQP